jgi:hypothetical protein
MDKMMRSPSLFALLAVWCLAAGVAVAQFSEMSSSVGLGPMSGYRVLATADWNNDQHVDFIGTDAVDTSLLQVWLFNGGSFYNFINVSVGAKVLYAAAADFDNDGRIDVLYTTTNGTMTLAFQNDASGIGRRVMVTPDTVIPESVNLFNVDSPCAVPHIYAVRASDTKGFLYSLDPNGGCQVDHEKASFTSVALSTGMAAMSASPDIDGDCSSDPIISVNASTGNSTRYQLLKSSRVLTTLPAKSFGRLSFADWSGDGAADFAVAACLDARGVPSAHCANSSYNSIVVVRNQIEGSACPDNDCCHGHSWGFDSIAHDTVVTSLQNVVVLNLSTCSSTGDALISSPGMIRAGDYDDDAIIDAVVASTVGPLVLHGLGGGQFSCALLANILNTEHKTLRGVGADPFFFDINDDGRLDIVTTNTMPSAAAEERGTMLAFRGNAAELGNYYLTALTINGAKVQGNTAWGAAIVGACHRFQYTDIDQNTHTGTATQATSSSSSALEPNRPHFGLAITFSYIINYATGYTINAGNVHNTWPVYLMPNSQIVVIADPYTAPEDWDLKLFLYGQRYMSLVLYAWLASLGVIGIPMVVLKFREIRSDRREIHKHQ